MKIAGLNRGDQVRVFGLPAVVEAQWWGGGHYHALFAVQSTRNAPERVILHSGEELHLESV